MRQEMKNLRKMACFFVILAVALVLFYRVFRFKYLDGIYSLDAFYSLEEDTVDVVVLGSSHAFEAVNPAVFWQEEGIAAFDLCGSIQPMWNTYYYLKEAFKTQQPDLVILEAYCTTMDLDYTDEGRIVKNYYGMKPSLDKLQAGLESAPREQWKDFLPEWVRYHNRYRELGKEDFLPYLGQTNYYQNWKGFCGSFEIMETDVPQNDFYTEERFPLLEKTEKYYRRILELAQEKNVPILVLVSPYYGISREEFGMYNRAADIAAEYDVPFLNANLLYEEIGIDFEKDEADWGHLNYWGSEKFTKYLGIYLKEHYPLADHRGDMSYASWDMNALCSQQEVYNHQLAGTDDLSDYLRELDCENYTVILSVTDDLAEEKREELIKPLELFGVDEFTSRNFGALVKQRGEFVFCSEAGAECLWHQEVTAGDLAVRNRTEEGMELYWGEYKQNKVEHGVNILVYDNLTETVADAVGFDSEKDWIGMH